MHKCFAIVENVVQLRLGFVEGGVVAHLGQRYWLDSAAEAGLGNDIHRYLLVALVGVLHLYLSQLLVEPAVLPLDVGVFLLYQPVLAAAVEVRVVVGLLGV